MHSLRDLLFMAQKDVDLIFKSSYENEDDYVMQRSLFSDRLRSRLINNGYLEHPIVLEMLSNIECASSRRDIEIFISIAISQLIDFQKSQPFSVRDVRSLSYQISDEISSLKKENSILRRRLIEKQGQEEEEEKEPGEVVTLEKLKGKQVLFAIMPFSDEYSDVWVGGITRAAKQCNLYPVRADKVTKSLMITEQIIEITKMAQVVVIDVTGTNPNVMFEFGYSYALEKPFVLISQNVESLPFDIRNIKTIPYSNCWSGIEQLEKDLQKYIKGALGSSTMIETEKKKNKVIVPTPSHP